MTLVDLAKIVVCPECGEGKGRACISTRDNETWGDQMKVVHKQRETDAIVQINAILERRRRRAGKEARA